MYLGEDFEEEEMARNMRAISSREDGQVFKDDFKSHRTVTVWHTYFFSLSLSRPLSLSFRITVTT